MTTKQSRLWGVVAAFLLAAAAPAQQVSTVTATNLLEPNFVTVDPTGVVYFTDSSDNRIVKFIPSTNALSTLAGQSGPAYVGTNNGFGSAARFSQPLGIVYDPYRGGLVVVDQGNQVLRFVSLAGAVSNLAGVEATMANPYGGFVDGPAAKAQFSFPVGIATDGTNLYIADAGNNAIRRLDTNNNVVTIQITNGYKFYRPEAVVVDNTNNLWIADTLNDTICVISNISVISNQSVAVAAGSLGQYGTNDSLLGSQALFDKPGGLLWDPYGAGLFISDTGNNTIRRLYTNGPYGFSVQTLAGTPGVAGYVDGALASARFDNPIGLAVDTIDNGYYVVDRNNNALRRVQTSPPQPAVSNPSIGYVTFPSVNGVALSQFNAVTDVTFDNAQIIAIEAEGGVQTFMTYGPTPPSPFLNTIPTPGPGSGNSPNIYAGDGLPASQIGPTVLSPQPDVTVYAVSEALGRSPSSVVSARFRFVTANPLISGNNSAAVTLTDDTAGASMYYTLDGSTPSSSNNVGGAIASGATISFVSISNVTLTVNATAPNFAPSGATVQVFNASNYVANQMTFGFSDGEASSRFIASAGHRFYVPITLSLLPNASMYDLQFNVTVTNLGAAPAVAPTYTFDSMLEQKELINGVVVYVTIPPEEFTGAGFQSLVFSDASEGLLGVGWAEIPPATNLYNTTQQQLITYSIAHETIFNSSSGQVIVGGYSFDVPANAATNQQYQIQIGRPSADADGFTENAVIQVVTNGSLGAGAINSIKNVTVGVAPYLVGDVAPFRWFNAGDFGDTNLLDNDVVEIFRSAVYGVARNLPGSDFYDALDSSDGSDNNLYNGNDATINNIKFGDGLLQVDDIYVTFRRSLDPALTWYERFWSNGIHYAQAVPNATPTQLSARPAAKGAAVAKPSGVTGALSSQAPSNGPRQITVAGNRLQASAGQTVQVPIQVLSADAVYPIRVAALNLDVIPLDGSPAITNAMSFTPASGLGAPTLTDSQGVNNYAAAWLDSTVTGVTNTNLIGVLAVTLPANATTNSSYLIHFEHFSASPNGIALFKPTLQDGLITVGSTRSTSSWADGIPDWWRLVYFGTVSNLLSAANLDPDGDGASNWQEYVAGTNPQDSTSVLQLTPGANFSIQWPSVPGKSYVLETSTALFSTNWTVLATNLSGTGQLMQIQDTNLPAPPARFYRVVVQ